MLNTEEGFATKSQVFILDAIIFILLNFCLQVGFPDAKNRSFTRPLRVLRRYLLQKPFICLSKSVKSFMYGPASEKEVISSPFESPPKTASDANVD